MKKSPIIFLIMCFLITAQNRVFAIDDWSSIYESDNESQYEKIISEQEFQNAIKAIEKYNKPNKKLDKKLKESGLKPDKNKNKQRLLFETPSRREPLLMLPVDVSHNGKVITRGFYLVKPVNRDDRYFISFSQGKDRVVAEFNASMYKTENLQKIAEDKQKAYLEKLDNDLLKVTYSSREFILEAYLLSGKTP